MPAPDESTPYPVPHDGVHTSMDIVDFIEVAGSLLVLSAFAAAQKGLLGVRSLAYLGLNIAGSLVLAVIALLHQSWGFLLLEGTWAIVSAASIIVVLRRRRIDGVAGSAAAAPPAVPR